MNDSELFALAALVLAESSLQAVHNQQRLNDGCALAYPDESPNFDILNRELIRRGVLVY